MSAIDVRVPFFRPDIGDEEIAAVVDVLRSGWLTSGPQVQRFELAFAAAVGARHAVAVNSCTAALHLAVDALGLTAGQGVLVPTMTFAATAEVVRYMGGTPILVDCDTQTLNMDLAHGDRCVGDFEPARRPAGARARPLIAGVIPVHVGGLMMDVAGVAAFAARHGLWVVEDAAHAFPAAWRSGVDGAWQRCGESTASVSCFSFYANKTITTAEGGMAVTDDPDLAQRMRLMSLHGLSRDAWGRYSGTGTWDYEIIAAGFKYNLTDIAAALGLCQLRRATHMRERRAYIASRFLHALATVEEIELPPEDTNRIPAWHLFPIRLRLERLSIDRNLFIEALRRAGVMCSVHWRPLHLHPYYRETLGYRPDDCPNATALFKRIVSLPIFPTMTETDIDTVIDAVRAVVRTHAMSVSRAIGA